MKTRTRIPARLALLCCAALPLLALAPAAPPAASPAAPPSPAASYNACQKSRVAARLARIRDAGEEYWSRRAMCENLPTPQERLQCRQAAQEAFEEAREECVEQYQARGDICDELGVAGYLPLIDPADFVRVVDNALFPLLPGTTFVFEEDSPEGILQVVVSVTHETREILGVGCTQVQDTVTLDGVLVEDTTDWFAQDSSGNVWYFGELSLSYEDGRLDSLDGSWTAGVDGAQPGIVMHGAPQVGPLYRQEFLIGEAEDVARVLSLSEDVTVPYGAFSGCLETEESTPLEPGLLEHKYYAPGVGVVFSVDLETGEQMRLVDIQLR